MVEDLEANHGTVTVPIVEGLDPLPDLEQEIVTQDVEAGVKKGVRIKDLEAGIDVLGVRGPEVVIGLATENPVIKERGRLTENQRKKKVKVEMKTKTKVKMEKKSSLSNYVCV